ncbi:mono/diheme cytochrome c family protein [Nitrobacteraceae bacterium AZCC 2161]
MLRKRGVTPFAIREISMEGRRRLRTLAAVLAVIVVAAASAAGLAYRSAIDKIARPDPQSFPIDLVEKGEKLALIGDCAVCHTASSGSDYAGGLPLSTPFGTLFTTNITPDEKTGIGTWSMQAFRRAMQEGVVRDGSHLYPAFPYDHYTHVADADIDSIYAFLMTRRPVEATTPDNKLIPPLGFRPLLAGWKLLFLRGGTWQPDASQSAEYNRGAYLAEGLGHCGSCHTPRNIMGGEVSSKPYAGGVAEGWVAPALNQQNPATRSWNADQIYTYLRTGIDINHSAASGPMAPVVHGLAKAPEADVRAISIYVASLMHGGAKPPEAPAFDQIELAATSHPVGAILFAGACAGCHGAGAPMTAQGRPKLSLATPVNANDPRDAIQVVLQGLRPEKGKPGLYMPALADAFTDAQVAELIEYVRARYSDKPAWKDLEAAVAKARKDGKS